MLGYWWVLFSWQLDEFGRIVIDGVERPPPATEETPLFEGWSGEGLGLNGENVPRVGVACCFSCA